MQTCNCIPRTPPLIGQRNRYLLAFLQTIKKWESCFWICTHHLHFINVLTIASRNDRLPLRIHIDSGSIAKAISTASPIPKYWENEVKETLDKDTLLGVLGKTTVGVLSTWVHRMVMVAKAGGSCRRVVDLSLLHKYCIRETHHIRPPFI